jgi:hypothetical protein
MKSYILRLYLAIAALSLLALNACGGGTSNSALPAAASSATASAQRLYNGTASVGDFLNITIDPIAHTLSYVNRSNGDTGTVSYTVNADGSYLLADATGNLLAAYEVPGYAILIQAAHTGPTHTTPSLITGVQSGPISLASLSAQPYNYMQFRTNSGGVEIGSAVISLSGTLSSSSYWPYGATNGSGNAFMNRSMPFTSVVPDVGGTFLTTTSGGGIDYVFGTANGQFLVDTPNGAILGFAKAATKSFNATNIGTYTAMLYMKNSVSTGPGNIESGTGTLTTNFITLDAAGNMTVRDNFGATVTSGTLVAAADAPYLLGAGQLNDTCFGLFTYRTTTPTSQRDTFVAFQGRAILFSTFTSALPIVAGNSYSYAYGVGLH